LCAVKEELDNADEEGIKIKEMAIMELGTLLKTTGQAEGVACVHCIVFVWSIVMTLLH